MCVKNFKINDELCTYKVWYPDNDVLTLVDCPSDGRRFLFLTNYHLLKGTDEKISRLTGCDDFTLFTPVISNYFVHFVATHKRCVQINFIEEGIQSYNSKFYDIGLNKAAPSIKNVVRFANHAYRSLNYVNKSLLTQPSLYMITNRFSDTDSSNKVVVIKNLYVPKIDTKYNLYGCNLFFFDAGVEEKHIRHESFNQVFSMFLNWYANEQKKLWIKFHPCQSIDIIDFVIYFLCQLQVEHEIIGNGVCGEAILLSSKNLRVFGFHSSLLFYATIWGHKAFSLQKMIRCIDYSANVFYNERIPKIFFESVQHLNLG